MAQPNYELGRIATEMLLDRTTGGLPRQMILEPRLVVRACTTVVRAAGNG